MTDSAKVALLLGSLLSEDSQERKDAEKKYAELKIHAPDGLASNLVAVAAENGNSSIRQSAAVYLRQLVAQQLQGCWQLTPGVTTQMKKVLLQLLQTEQDKKVRVAICGVVSEFGSAMIKHNDWPELGIALLEMAKPRSPAGPRASALRVLSSLMLQIPDTAAGDIAVLVSSAMEAADKEVQKEGLSLLVTIMEGSPRVFIQKAEACLPAVLTAFRLCITHGDAEYAVEFTSQLIDIAEWCPQFFKPQLGSFVEILLQASNEVKLSQSLRATTVEVLLTMCKRRPNAMQKIPGFVDAIVQTFIAMMLTVKDNAAWLDTIPDDNDYDDEMQNLYDIGEAGIDRLCSALGGHNTMPAVFAVVGQDIRKPEWQFKFTALMAIAQTVEYLPDETLDQHLDEIVALLISHLQHDHPRVRFAAAQAIGQAALDHLPAFQRAYNEKLLPVLLRLINDPVPRVRLHALSCTGHLLEEAHKGDVKPHADALVQQCLVLFSEDQHLPIKQESLSLISTLVGVLGKDAVGYYSRLFPLLCRVIERLTDEKEQLLRGKAIECLTILGTVCGSRFAKDAPAAATAVVKLSQQNLSPENPLLDYIPEALGRLCRAMQADFLPFLPLVMQHLLKDLQVETFAIDIDTADDDVIVVSQPDGKFTGAKTLAVNTSLRALDTLETFVQVLMHHFGEFINPSVDAVLALYQAPLNQDLKQAALSTMRELLQAARAFNDKHGLSDHHMISKWLVQTIEISILDIEQADEIEKRIERSVGMAQCLRAAGSDVLSPLHVQTIVNKIFTLIRQSTARRNELLVKKASPQMDDEEELEGLQEQCDSEHQLRCTLVEILAALMQNYTQTITSSCMPLLEEFLRHYLSDEVSPEDRIVALYAADDVLLCMGDAGAPLWPAFLDKLVESIEDPDPAVRAAACTGILPAVRCPSFPHNALASALPKITVIIKDAGQQGGGLPQNVRNAVDLAAAALGAIMKHRPEVLGGEENTNDYCVLWLSVLPILTDEEEAQRVHEDFVQLCLSENRFVLGPNNSRLSKVVEICASIYGTDFSTPHTDRNIRAFMEKVGFQEVSALSQQFSKRLKQSLARIHRDALESAAA